MAAPLKVLSVLHRRAMTARLLGLTYGQIGAELKRSESTVAQWFIDPLFRAEYEALCARETEAAQAVLFQAATEAAKTQIGLLGAHSEMVAHLAAKDILDRVGLRPVERQDVTSGGEAVRFTLTIDGHRVMNDADQAEPGAERD